MDTFVYYLIKGCRVMSKARLFHVSKTISERIADTSFVHKFRKAATAFTRKRKMPFCDIINFIISCTNRSLQTELDDYFHNKGSETVSRQAFSKTRENLKHEAFIDLNDLLVRKFEEEDDAIATYRGYRVFSADGALIDLPNTDKMRERFGFSENGTDKTYAKGLAITAFDVLNKITVFGELYRYDDSEKRRILDIADAFAKLYSEKTIWLLDRGYPSFELFTRFEQNSQNFLIRASSQSLAEINNAKEADQIIEITRNSLTIKLRIVNVDLSSGESEKLVTNLYEGFSHEDLRGLYAARWGIETNYRFWKCKTFLEVFTGESETAVLQDFHASILVLNMAAIVEREQAEILRENNAVCANGKFCGCEYRPNKTNIIREIKHNFVKLMLCEKKTNRAFTQFFLARNIKRYAFLDIPGRSFPRNFAKNKSRRSTHPKNAF